jgi:hypothetical protein
MVREKDNKVRRFDKFLDFLDFLGQIWGKKIDVEHY